MNLASLFVSIKADDRGARRSIDGVGSAMTGLARAASTATAAVGVVSAAVSGLVIGLDRASRAGRLLNDSFIDVQKAASLSKREMADLRTSMIDVARATPGLTPEALAEIAIEGAKLGVAKEDLTDYAVAVGKAAVAMDDLPAGEVAASLGAMRTMFDLSTKSVGNIASATAKLATTTAASASTLFNFGGRVGTVASQMGLSISDTLGYGATLLNLKISAENAASGFTELLAAAGKHENLQAIAAISGVLPHHFAMMVQANPDMAIKRLLLGLKGMRTMGAGGAVAALEALGIGSQNAQSAILALAKGLDTVAANQRVASEEMDTGAKLAEIVALNSGKASATWSQATTALTALSVVLADMLAPAFGLVVGGIVALSGAAESITATISPVIVKMTQDFERGLGIVRGEFWATVQAVGAAIANWDVTLRMGIVSFQRAGSVIVQVIQQIPGNVIAFGAWFYDNWRSIFADAFNAVLTVGQNFLANLSDLWGMIRDVVSDPLNAEVDLSKLNVLRDVTKGVEFTTPPLEVPGFKLDTAGFDAELADLSGQLADRTTGLFLDTVAQAKPEEKPEEKPKKPAAGGRGLAVTTESRGVQDLMAFTKGVMDAALKGDQMKTQIDLQRSQLGALERIAQNTAGQPGVV